jgi:hypothetical protein
MHEMSVECWCYPETETIDGSTFVRHRERALSDGAHMEKNRTRERDEISTSMSRFL